MKDYFRGRTAVLATAHGKEQVIAPMFKHKLGVVVVVPTDFDTDQFGTFTGDVARTGNQLETARAKVLAGMRATGVDLGIASEGSFDTDPGMPFVQSNLELVILIDLKHNLEIHGYYRSLKTQMHGEYVSSTKDALVIAKKIGFPGHGVIVRTHKHRGKKIYKDLNTLEAFGQQIATLFRNIFRRKLYLESDMRAHRNPTRMENIRKATEDLVKNIQSLCPQCGIPGFVVVDATKGAPCSLCGAQTQEPISFVYACGSCSARVTIPVAPENATVDPGQCTKCNP